MSEGRKPDFSVSYDLGNGIQIGADAWPDNKGGVANVSVWIRKFSDKHQKYFPKDAITAAEMTRLQALQAHANQLLFSEREIGEPANPPARKQRLAPVALVDDEVPF